MNRLKQTHTFFLCNPTLYALALLIIASMIISGCEAKPDSNSLLATAKITDMSGKVMSLDDGTTLTFEENIEDLFQQTNNARDELINQGFTPVTEDYVEEYEDRIRIRQVTIVEVSDEVELLEERPEDVPESDVESNITEIDNPLFIGGFIDEYLMDCRDDALCDLSREELLELLEEKDGEYEIVETIDLNKIPMRFDELQFRMENSNIRMEPSEVKLRGLKPIAVQAGEGDSGFLRQVREEMQYIGPVNKRQRFINGFTYGLDYSYSYQKTWKKRGVNVASIRVYSYLGYGVGLRIPMEGDITISKAVAFSNEPDYNAKVGIKTMDLDAEDYKELGIPEDLIFDGKELVLQVGAVSGAEIKLLGHTILNQQQGAIIDNNKDFKPPIGSERVNLGTIEFPGIDTGLYYGADNLYVATNIGLGFDLEGNKITMDCHSDTSSGCPDKITFTDDGTQSFNMTIIPDDYPNEDEFGKYDTFGISIDNLAYHPQAVFDFKLALEGGLYTGKYLFKWVRVTTPWISVYRLGIDLPSLESHIGTPKNLTVYGNKVYLRNTVHNVTKLLPPVNLTNPIGEIKGVNLTVKMVNKTASGNSSNGSNTLNITLRPVAPIIIMNSTDEENEDDPDEEEEDPIEIQPISPIVVNATVVPSTQNTSNTTLQPIAPLKPMVILK